MMTGSCSGASEPEEQLGVSEELVTFMGKRSDVDAPRQTAKLKAYVDLHQKRRRADAARRNAESRSKGLIGKKDVEQKEKSSDKKRGSDHPLESGSQRCLSRARSSEPADACCRRRRRRRRCRRRRRRRSCRRRRRRRSCRRRRRRSRSRCRRRRSCRRRRRSCRRRRR